MTPEQIMSIQNPYFDDSPEGIIYAAALARVAELLRKEGEGDSLAVDEAWLRSVGFKDRHAHSYRNEKSLVIGDLEIWALATNGPKCWDWGAHWGTTLLREVATRGDVRRLCAALGVKLEEERT